MDTAHEDELMDILARVRADLAEVRGDGGPKTHGTRTGYARHLRNKTTPCEECRAANRDHQRERRGVRKATDPKVVRIGFGGKKYEYTFRNEDEYEAWNKGTFDPRTRMESARLIT